jgi:hypothetical protein
MSAPNDTNLPRTSEDQLGLATWSLSLRATGSSAGITRKAPGSVGRAVRRRGMRSLESSERWRCERIVP